MLLLNTLANRSLPLEERDRLALGRHAPGEVAPYLTACPHYRPTSLLSLGQLARSIGVGELWIKDERERLGLGSFKALGGAYAVIRHIADLATKALGTLPPERLLDPNVRAIAAGVTVGCATDGNHGKSVAAGAKMIGCEAAIFLHEGVSEEREAAIAALGARTIRVPGNYDDAVAESLRVCTENGWPIISDTSWPGYEAVPLRVMQGYTVMADEVLRVIEAPTHIFVQAGVGGLAAAVAAHLADRFPQDRPMLIVVEPDKAACLLESARGGRWQQIQPSGPTVMAMLECYEPSRVAWRILSRTADGFMTVDDEAAIEAMRRLARPLPGDRAIVAGESGGVGLAGLLTCMGEPESRLALKLNGSSRILLFNTEGATDPAIYCELTGFEPFAEGPPDAVP